MNKIKAIGLILTGSAVITICMPPMQTLAATADMSMAMILADTMGSAVGGAATAAAATLASLVLGRKKRSLLEQEETDDEF